jgi:hypothetical protein
VAAAVVRSDPKLDEAELRAWWSERLVYYQQPKFVIFIDELPRNSLGKVLRASCGHSEKWPRAAEPRALWTSPGYPFSPCRCGRDQLHVARESGVVAIVLAWECRLRGALFGESLGYPTLIAGFPTDLFLTLVGVTLLFTG